MAGIVTAPSVTAVLRQYAENQPEKEAAAFVTDPVREDGAQWLTYAELDARARSLAVRLRHSGLQPGDRAVLLHPAGLDFVTAFLGCLYAGVVAVPSSLPGRYRHERHRVRRIADDAGAAAILTDTPTRGEVEEWLTEEGLGGLPLMATDEEGPAPDAWTMPPTRHATLAVLQYTSGSTGDPKGVMISHGNLLHNSARIADVLKLDGTTRGGGWIPHFHDMGLMGLMLPPLMTGSATVLMSPSTFLKRPHLWLHMIDRFDIHYSAAPDFAYEVCSRRITEAQAEGLDLSRWRHAVDGSEPVRAAVLDRFHQQFAHHGLRADALAPCYGMAEATLFVSGAIDGPPSSLKVSADRLERNEFRPTADAAETGRDVVSCGPPRGAEVRVVDPETLRTLPEGGVGELWLRGPVVGHGYWGREATNEADFRATTAEGDTGYLRTGDLGALHEGEVYVTGRIKDVLNLRGRNLYPQDIEHELRVQRPELGNLAGACFSVPGTDGQGPDDVLVVTHEVRGIKDEERLRELATGMRLTVAREFGAPVGAVLLLRPGGVRRTTSGKVQRSAMRELFRAGALQPTYAEYQPHLLPAMPAEDGARA
ncbi:MULTISPECIES: fatty acyl-AMP ligase [Streptomyces]|uniref:fatty acyl-AMP ligase n=1 Tax=Streptomyces TaxID=1883 RepID=UPI00099E3DDE|nr:MULTISPECIES: fatty acyl-AMP ligase [Streptomyces]MDI5908826.1 fatty acyl-AMP ligase [Streptomyces sp. 12257]